MFQVIFIFSDWILIEEQTIASSFTLSVLRETDFQKILPGGLSGGLGHEYKSINQKKFSTHVWIYKSQKIQQAFWRDKTL